jgi:hypothetical protein
MIESLKIAGMLHCGDVYSVRAALSRLPLRRYDVEVGLVTVDYDPKALPHATLVLALSALGLSIVARRILQTCLDRARPPLVVERLR